MENLPDSFEIKRLTLDKILNYLSERPFKEVAGLIGEIHQQVQPQLGKNYKQMQFNAEGPVG